jgi:hypothetical protein
MTEPLDRPVATSSRASTARPAEDLRAADPNVHHGAGDHSSRAPDRASPPRTPRWVKASGIVAIVLVLLFVGLHVTGNVPSHTPSFSGTDHGMQAP